MGVLEISDGTRNRRLPLLSSNVLGRSKKLGLGCIPNKSVPSFWVEIRYLKNTWAWRSLQADERTKGAGAHLKARWRKLSKKLTLESGVSLRLIEESPPEEMIDNLRKHERIPIRDIDFIRHNERGYFLDTDSETIALEDGEIFVLDGESYQFWDNNDMIQTFESVFTIEDGPQVDIDILDLKAYVSVAKKGVELKGEHIRILAAYAKARLDDGDNGGWRSKEEIFEVWIALGGNETSNAKRVNWERSKICTKLFEQGVAGTNELFEGRREGSVWLHRLNIASSNISFIE